MTKYQDRMTKAIWVSTAYVLGGFFTLKHYDAPFLAWLVFFSTIAVLAGVAIAADAVFDSLRELIDHE